MSTEPRPGDLRLLIAELDAELNRLRRLVAEFERARTALDDPAAEMLIVYGAAALLESFYTGIEKALRRIGQSLGGLPSGESWHRDLLSSMTLDIEGLRPPVLSPEAGRLADPYLAFRHRFRNLYVFDLERAPMKRLLADGAETYAVIERDLGRFIKRLKEWAEALDSSS